MLGPSKASELTKLFFHNQRALTIALSLGVKNVAENGKDGSHRRIAKAMTRSGIASIWRHGPVN